MRKRDKRTKAEAIHALRRSIRKFGDGDETRSRTLAELRKTK